MSDVNAASFSHAISVSLTRRSDNNGSYAYCNKTATAYPHARMHAMDGRGGIHTSIAGEMTGKCSGGQDQTDPIRWRLQQ